MIDESHNYCSECYQKVKKKKEKKKKKKRWFKGRNSISDK
jgi:hypothetical protein